MRNCLLVFLIIIFVLVLPTYFFVVNIGQVLTPTFIRDEVKKTNMIEKISESLPEQLSSLSGDDEQNKEAIKEFFSQIPKSQIQSTLQSNFDNNLTALSNPSVKELVFDISIITKSLPSELKSVLQGSGENVIQDKYTYQIPLEIRFYRFLINNLLYIKLAGIIFFGLFLLTIAILPDYWRTKFRAISLSLLVPGFAILLPSFIIRIIPFNLPTMEGVPQVVSLVANDLFKIARIDIAGLYIWEGGILIIVALVLFGLSFLFKLPDEPVPGV